MKWIIFLMISFQAMASNTPGANALRADQVLSKFSMGKKRGLIPEDQVISQLKNSLEKMGIKSEHLKKNILKSHKIFQNLRSGNFQPPPIAQKRTLLPGPRPVVRQRRPLVKKIRAPRPKNKKISPIQFHDTFEEEGSWETITLPSASLATGTLMAGIEVSQDVALVDVRIHHAFLGPNKAVVEMTDCHAWATVSGNYNTERVYGEIQSLSCRAPNGETFEVAVTGQIRDAEDEYLGIKAELVTRGKIAATALNFLQEGTKKFGEAMAQAQVVTEVVSGGPHSYAEKEKNVSRNQSRYMLGESIAGATGGFLQWWIDYYKGLSPTLAVAPGTKVFLSINRGVQIPKIFFENSKVRSNTGSLLSTSQEEE